MSNDSDVGARIRTLREARGMTRPVLAGLCGRGVEWLKKIENGERQLRDYGQLLRVAAGLGVTDLAQITGGPSQPVADAGATRHPSVPRIWEVMQQRHLPQPPLERAPDLAALAARVEAAWRLWHTSRHNRTDLGKLLPDLLGDVHDAVRASDGDQRRTAQAVLTDAYALTQQHSAYIVGRDYAIVVIDRAMMAADAADDPVALGHAASAYTNVMRSLDYADEALRALTAAMDTLRPRLVDAPAGARALYGFLKLQAAGVWSRLGREGETWANWDAADAIAKSLPAGYSDPRKAFGRANVDIWQVTLQMDLRASGRAIAAGDHVDPDAMPSPERRSRLWTDLGRAHLTRDEPLAALSCASRAYAESPEAVRHTPVARLLVEDLTLRCRGQLKREAAALAAKVTQTD